MMSINGPLMKQEFAKQIGLSLQMVVNALNYIKDKQADPDAVEVKN